MLRLAHLSDIHITAPGLEWRGADWFNKRLAAWANFRLLGRGYRFRHADLVLTKLMEELRQRPIDHVVFSGDATALGFEAEFKKAAVMLEVGALPGIAVPGNHDYCTIPAAQSGLFERYFAPWLVGTRLDEATYPFAQRVGHVWLVAVNSSTGNRLAWDAGGSVGPEQLQRLHALLASLDPGPRVLITHFPLCLSDGRREPKVHGLRDVDEVVKVATAGGVGLWLHGHRHHAYYFQQPPSAPFPVICIGSSTQTDRWSYGEYEIDGAVLRATRREFDAAAQAFADRETFTLTLP